MAIAKNPRLLLTVLAFNAISAFWGGLALMHGNIDMPDWIAQTDFNSLYFPGVILFAIVGGSALIAAVALYKKVVGWQLAGLASAVVLLCWIGGEIVSIRTFHWLQLIYIMTAFAIIWLTPSSKTNN